jgi:hypothetical protein
MRRKRHHHRGTNILIFYLFPYLSSNAWDSGRHFTEAQETSVHKLLGKLNIRDVFSLLWRKINDTPQEKTVTTLRHTNK